MADKEIYYRLVFQVDEWGSTKVTLVKAPDERTALARGAMSALRGDVHPSSVTVLSAEAL